MVVAAASRETGRGATAPGGCRGRLSRGGRESGTRFVSLLLCSLSPFFDYHVWLVQVVGDREDREDSRHKAGEGRGWHEPRGEERAYPMPDAEDAGPQAWPTADHRRSPCLVLCVLPKHRLW